MNLEIVNKQGFFNNIWLKKIRSEGQGIIHSLSFISFILSKHNITFFKSAFLYFVFSNLKVIKLILGLSTSTFLLYIFYTPFIILNSQILYSVSILKIYFYEIFKKVTLHLNSTVLALNLNSPSAFVSFIFLTASISCWIKFCSHSSLFYV